MNCNSKSEKKSEHGEEILVPECHICALEVSKEDGFYCSDCGEFTCNSCGDGNLCDECLDDEVFFLDIL